MLNFHLVKSEHTVNVYRDTTAVAVIFIPGHRRLKRIKVDSPVLYMLSIYGALFPEEAVQVGEYMKQLEREKPWED